MARADLDTVIQMTDTSLDPQLVALLIDDASVWVDNYLVGKCAGLAEDKLESIERYLAAAFVKQVDGQDGQLVQAQRGDVQERMAQFGPRDGPGSVFLRWAAGFDPCGIVAEHFLAAGRFRARVGDGYAVRGSR